MKKIYLILLIVGMVCLVSAATFSFNLKDAEIPARNQTIKLMTNLSYDCGGVSKSREVNQNLQAHEIQFMVSCKNKIINIKLGELRLKENENGFKCFDNELEKCKQDSCRKVNQTYDTKTNNCIEV